MAKKVARGSLKPAGSKPRSTGKRSLLEVPEETYSARRERLRAQIRALDASHLLVSNPVDVGYLTGFLGGDSYLLLPAQAGKPLIISDFRYQEELQPLNAACRVFIRKGTMQQAVAEVLSDTAVERCAFQAEHWTVADRDTAAAAVGAAKLVASTGLVGSLRKTKDAHEIALLERAIRIQEGALLEVLPTIEPGQTELAVAGRLELAMRSHGASGAAFKTIVAAGATGSLPHYHPTDRKLTKGGLLIDWGATYRGYHGDMTRTFSIGPWPLKLREIYQVVLDAHELAAASLAPGRLGAEIDAIARQHIANCGYGDFFGHGLGHGLGMSVHEEPRLDFRVKPEEMRPGNVFTNEPGIYLPGVGGVRIEDDYVITDTGSRCLGSLPRTLAWATLA